MNKWFFWSICVLCLFLLDAVDSWHDVQQAKAGLQQCRVGFSVLWKRSAKNEN